MFKLLKEYRVYIKDNSAVYFPEKCIVCGDECTSEATEIAVYYEYAFMGFIERWKSYFSHTTKIIVPIHKTCNESFKNKKAIREKLIIGIIILSISISYLIRNEIDFWFWIIAFIPALIIDYILNISWFAKPFRFSKNQIRYKFVFGNKGYAGEFQDLNKANLFDIGNLSHLKR